MVFIFRFAARSCKNIPCFPISKLFATAYSVNAKPGMIKASPVHGEANYLTDLAPPRAPSINVKQIVSSDINKHKKEQQNEAISIKKKHCTENNPEWKNICLDYTKLHKYCFMLSKIRLTSLVVITAMSGYALAPGAFDLYTFAMCSLGTGLVSATANTINQFFEVPFDAQMSRTKNRVIVRGYLTPAQAMAFATVSGITGLSVLYYGVNGITALLGASNLILYTLIYTPMKRVSIANTWVGSVVGAIPPLMGWAGCVGDISSLGAWIAPGILYAWQFPHFNALSWNLRPDYSRAGYRMMAVTNPDVCRRTALRYTAAIMGLCYLAPVLEVTNWWFFATSMPLNVYFLYLAWQFHQHADSKTSRKLFRFSLIHLPLLMVLMLLSKKYWFGEKQRLDSTFVNGEKKNNDNFTVLTRYLRAAESST